MRKILSASLVFAAFLFLFASPSFAEIKAKTFSIAPFIGGYTVEGNEDLDTDLVYGLRLGYDITKRWGVEGTFDYLHPDTGHRLDTKADVYGYRLEALYHFLPEGRLVPFVAAGIGDRTIDYQDRHINKDRNQILAVYGGGLKYFLTDNIALRGDIRHLILFNNNYNNLEYTIGLAFYFGGPKTAPVIVDSDNDDVPDNLDKCPGTPIGIRVDQDGCPPDSDKDGVPDYLDECPGTPEGVKVDKDGCPINIIEKRPETQAVVKAPTEQIVLMPDADGKVGQIEISTSVGSQKLEKPWESTEVVSSDLTPTEPKVMDEKEVRDTFKDALAAQPLPPAVFILHFKSGDTKLTNESLKLITEIVETIKSQKSDHVRVIGHTDTVASIKYNRSLSELRAKSVTNTLVARGVDRAIIKTEFYGKEKLLIQTKDGVSEPRNRRVEIIIR